MDWPGKCRHMIRRAIYRHEKKSPTSVSDEMMPIDWSNYDPSVQPPSSFRFSEQSNSSQTSPTKIDVELATYICKEMKHPSPGEDRSDCDTFPRPATWFYRFRYKECPMLQTATAAAYIYPRISYYILTRETMPWIRGSHQSFSQLSTKVSWN